MYINVPMTLKKFNTTFRISINTRQDIQCSRKKWKKGFAILSIYNPFLANMGRPTQILGPIGSAVLKFIGYKKQTPRQKKVYI